MFNSKTLSNWFGLKLHGGAIHISYHKPSLWSASLSLFNGLYFVP